METSNKPPIAVGMKVTTEYWKSESDLVRTILAVEKSYKHSGWVARADDGGKCPACDRPRGTLIHPIDSSWFVPIAEETPNSNEEYLHPRRKPKRTQ